MLIDQDLEIAVRTGELVRDRIEEETGTFKLVGACKISRDAVNNWVRASQDEKRTNELADAIRRAMKMPAAELDAIVAEIESRGHVLADNVGLAVVIANVVDGDDVGVVP